MTPNCDELLVKVGNGELSNPVEIAGVTNKVAIHCTAPTAAMALAVNNEFSAARLMNKSLTGEKALTSSEKVVAITESHHSNSLTPSIMPSLFFSPPSMAKSTWFRRFQPGISGFGEDITNLNTRDSNAVKNFVTTPDYFALFSDSMKSALVPYPSLFRSAYLGVMQDVFFLSGRMVKHVQLEIILGGLDEDGHSCMWRGNGYTRPNQEHVSRRTRCGCQASSRCRGA